MLCKGDRLSKGMYTHRSQGDKCTEKRIIPVQSRAQISSQKLCILAEGVVVGIRERAPASIVERRFMSYKKDYVNHYEIITLLICVCSQIG